MQHGWNGAGWDGVGFVVLAGITVVAGWLALRVYRWG
jgi:hypothetical protein